MPISLSGSGGASWKLLIPTTSLSGIITKTEAFNPAGYNRLKIIGSMARETAAADSLDTVTIKFNGTAFDALYTNMQFFHNGAGVFGNSFVDGNNQFSMNLVPRDPLSSVYHTYFECFIELNVANNDRYYLNTRGIARYNSASPTMTFFNHFGVIETTTALSSITIANASGVNFDANSYFQMWASKSQ